MVRPRFGEFLDLSAGETLTKDNMQTVLDAVIDDSATTNAKLSLLQYCQSFVEQNESTEKWGGYEEQIFLIDVERAFELLSVFYLGYCKALKDK